VIALLRTIGGALGLVPKWVWYLLAAAAAWHFALAWHRGQVKAHDAEVIAARDAAWQLRFDAMHKVADRATRQLETAAAAIAAQQKEAHDATVRDNAAVAADLRLHGAGKAAAPANCRPVGLAALPAAAGGPERTGGGANPPASPLSAADGLSRLPSGARDDFAIIPWSWLTEEVAKPADDSRAEVIAWRTWWPKMNAAFEDMRKRLTDAAAKQARH
jgi:hypothetical protein